MPTVTHQPTPGDEPDVEPATMPLPRRAPGRTLPGRPPVTRPVAPSPDAIDLLVLAMTGVC